MPTASPRTSSPRCRAAAGCSSSPATPASPTRARRSTSARSGASSACATCWKAAFAAGGDRLRISGQLIDAASGAHLWADRFDGDARRCLRAAGPDHRKRGRRDRADPAFRRDRAAAASRPSQLDAYDLLLRAYGLISEFTPESMAAALDCLDQALAIDPAYAPAMAAAAYCHAQRHFQGWVQPDDAIARGRWRSPGARPSSRRMTRRCCGWRPSRSGTWRKRTRTGGELFNRSLAINPNSAMALTLAGWIETMRGNQATAAR